MSKLFVQRLILTQKKDKTVNYKATKYFNVVSDIVVVFWLLFFLIDVSCTNALIQSVLFNSVSYSARIIKQKKINCPISSNEVNSLFLVNNYNYKKNNNKTAVNNKKQQL